MLSPETGYSDRDQKDVDVISRIIPQLLPSIYFPVNCSLITLKLYPV
jgi:hypothetical protein